jgi:hypothetical protein
LPRLERKQIKQKRKEKKRKQAIGDEISSITHFFAVHENLYLEKKIRKKNFTFFI